MITQVRQSNFELLRIICMLMVMTVHAIGYINEEDLVGLPGAINHIIGQLCMICVDVFVMISGWFGIKATWCGAAKLLFQVLYITVLCAIVCHLFGLPVSFHKDILPFLLLGQGYWFVVAYLILYALSPILNKFIDHADQKTYRAVLLSWLAVEFLYGFLLDTGSGHFAFGLSPLFFIGLYLLARYARLYPGKLFSLPKRIDFTVYALLSLLSAIMLWYGYKWFRMGFHLNHYDSPLCIAASLFFLLGFSKMHFQSKPINWIASSAFAIYLIHEHPLVSGWYDKVFDMLSDSLPLYYLVYPAALCAIVCIGFICILIDKPRVLLWDIISRKITPNASRTLSGDKQLL